ncbi:LLM class flavin-dependent oxidoreductase [Cryptosporangium minutisporangium]|uniref:LLM class flavin-dependent oxidoreductase n=1 Tax=Cryptosporangium minutisporangium TaxID=113569 RepID=A0ABP6T9C6_9ACTN
MAFVRPDQLRIGYLLPTRDRLAAGDSALGPVIAGARRAEALGFDSVWVGDSPLTRPRADPLLVLAAVAAVTTQVTLGTAVLLAALRHPILLAHQLATLDRIADGRLVVGMGAGFPHPVTEAQFATLGVGFAHRSARLDESIDAIRLLWAGGPASFAGTHVRFQDVTLGPTPAQVGGPPIWMAGGGSALRRVARQADGWLPYPPTWTAYTEEWAALQQSAADHDRPDALTPAFYATVCLDEDPERGRQRARASIQRYYNAPLEYIEARQAVFVGTAAGCAAWLGRYATAGARHVVVRFAVENQSEAVEEFAQEVFPLLATLNPHLPPSHGGRIEAPRPGEVR